LSEERLGVPKRAYSCTVVSIRTLFFGGGCKDGHGGYGLIDRRLGESGVNDCAAAMLALAFVLRAHNRVSKKGSSPPS
jgi:hypothetical protein